MSDPAIRVQELRIKNIGMIAEETIKFDHPLIIFYGEIRQGKTTILNAVRWVCGGSFPSDIIRHGQKEAAIELAFNGGSIRRTWYVSSKDGSTKAREIQFIRTGRPVSNPVAEIRRFLNPFLLNQDHLRNMSELERKQFFAELFAVDTTALDTEATNKDREASDLRAKILGYGEIDVTPVETVNLVELQSKLTTLRDEYQQACTLIETKNAEINDHNRLVDRRLQSLEETQKTIARLKTELQAAEGNEQSLNQWLTANPHKKTEGTPTQPDTAVLEAQIQQGAAQNVRAEQYQANLKRAEQKKADQQTLDALEGRLRQIKSERIKALKNVTTTCGIKELAFDEDGNFTYKGTMAGMLSTSEIMQLSSELSALYPPGFGIELLDRGESLGKSIFGFIERAKREEKTILATIVGERPATVPPEVGVFVVENGKVKP